MKAVLTVISSLATMLLGAAPAAAWDPEKVIDPPPPAVSWAPEPAAVPPPPGIYLVTDTYAGDVVIHSGAVTTYATETVHQTTGSYARVLETVGTGGPSAYDGASFNGRAAMTDGRAVAGTYYENYVRLGDTFTPVSVVFFQDDAEIARALRLMTSRGSAPIDRRSGSIGPGFVWPTNVPASGSVAPIVDHGGPGEPGSPARPPAFTPTPLPDRAIEVLRGRRIGVSLDTPGARTWRLVSGEAAVLGPTSAPSGEPFVARWDRLPPPGGTWVVRFVIDFIDGTSRELALTVSVRAPGLVE
jgi:hypothetical protein